MNHKFWGVTYKDPLGVISYNKGPIVVTSCDNDLLAVRGYLSLEILNFRILQTKVL